MSLNKEIRSLLTGAEKTERHQSVTAPEHRLPNSSPGFPLLFQRFFGEGNVSFYSGATLGLRVKQFLAGIHIRWLQNQLCGFETDTYEAKVAVSF